MKPLPADAPLWRVAEMYLNTAASHDMERAQDETDDSVARDVALRFAVATALASIAKSLDAGLA